MSESDFRFHVPEQGISRTFGDLSELIQFIEGESRFWNDLAPLNLDHVKFNGQTYGSIGLQLESTHRINRMLATLKKGNTGEFNEFITQARALRTIVGQGALGEHIKRLMLTDKDTAKFVVMLCSQGTLGNKLSEILSPFRAAAFANPAFLGFNDLTTANLAAAQAIESKNEIGVLKKDLHDFSAEKREVIQSLEQAFHDKLVLAKPAELWRKIQQSNRTSWRIWFVAFCLLTLAPGIFTVLYSEQVIDFVSRVVGPNERGISIGGLAAITVPALFYAWLLKNVSRLLIQSGNLSEDAAHREALAMTYLGLAENPS